MCTAAVAMIGSKFEFYLWIVTAELCACAWQLVRLIFTNGLSQLS
jgi:hypothetical protein